ncbi:MAG: hypothetical protein JST69_06785 [Bacteroidetes bacterium]|nr:hypothetical protein [Bacteroidota bacterium]
MNVWIIVGIIALIWYFSYRSGNTIVTCQSCGWRGRKKKWNESGHCPNCKSDLYEKEE